MPARHRRPSHGRHRAPAPPRTPCSDAAATAGRALRTAGTVTALALPVGALGLAATATPAAAAPVTALPSTCAPVGVGASGAAVRAIQAAVGTTPDGGYGPMTAAAVAGWQTAHGLPPVGVVGPRTWNSFPAALGAAGCSATVTLPAGSPRSCAYLVPGSTGTAVLALRRALRLADGTSYDGATSAAVSAWQTRRGMASTGTVGGATWSALGLTHTPACTAPATGVVSGASASGPVVLPTTGSASGTSSGGSTGATLATATGTSGPGGTGTGPTPPTVPLSSSVQQQLAASVVTQVRSLEAAPDQAPSAAATTALAFARAQLGVPYVYAGTTSAGYDCSGLVLASYRAAGIPLDRTAAQQYADGPTVSLIDLRPGDTVYYATDLQNPATIYHTAMYAGAGLMVEAAKPGTLVRLVALRTGDLYPTAARPSAHTAASSSGGGTAGVSAWNTRQVQQLLVNHGYAISVDGGYGPQTTAAVAAFQTSRGLPATGVMNAATWTALSA